MSQGDLEKLRFSRSPAQIRVIPMSHALFSLFELQNRSKHSEIAPLHEYVRHLGLQGTVPLHGPLPRSIA